MDGHCKCPLACAAGLEGHPVDPEGDVAVALNVSRWWVESFIAGFDTRTGGSAVMVLSEAAALGQEFRREFCK